MNPEAFSTPVRGPSDSIALRTFAPLAVLGVFAYGARWWNVIASGGWSSPAALACVAALGGMAGSRGVFAQIAQAHRR